jgi:hypothetical protein
VEPPGQFEALTDRADEAEREAWRTLEPFLAVRPADKLAEPTDSQPIVEES